LGFVGWPSCRVMLCSGDAFLGFSCRVIFFFFFLGALCELGFFWVHVGALSYTSCIIGWRPFKFALF
jgi:hypothetical protein